MLKTALGRLRVIGLIEGTSFAILLLIAMPLKYLADMPGAVKIVGGAHGGLWVLLLIGIAETALRRRWSVLRIAVAVLASIVPLGTFVFDVSLRREQRELTTTPAESPPS